MTNAGNTHRTRVIVGAAVATLAIAAALLVPTLLSADAQPSPPRATTTTTPPEGDTRDDQAPGDGRHFGAITAAYVGPPELVFDAMDLLTGDEARAAASADGVPAGDTGDFYVRNRDERTVSLPVAGDVRVTRVDCSGGRCVEGAAWDYDALTMTFDSNAGNRAGSGERRYWLTVKDGFVVRIDEKYVP